ncbi:hypothetical protein PILCRDRAFT_820544 [Piloderma croceum F 1598]|uniref:Protein kinase domain-containing protein n=1 Tax=Piloderma croceum (strain F 1598) TaxID=765440 RepID=A0A0C3FTK0_PILCF|nr:hypothetical protein PILCRDRAFT_820544 [Piloderma croceum F 1598]
MHKNLEQLDIESSPLATTERKVQTLSRRQPSAKAAGKRRAVEGDNSNEQNNAREVTGGHSAQIHRISFPPLSPENALNYNPWNSSQMDLSSSGSPLPPIEPTVDGPISPAPDQNVLQLPDFTGKIRREDEYPVGRGGFADVWRGILCLPSGECKVAVKVLQARTHDSELEQKISKRIRREIAIWQGLKHENVLPLLGITSDFGRYMSLVSPWLENGSLMQYLDKNRDTLGISRRLQLACEVAAGLSYLHESQVVHGDLTGANVLITNDGSACLCDFGLSTLVIAFHGTSFYTSTVGGNARWTAPEIYRVTDNETTRTVTVQTDVYSFGCILLEILSGQVPYHYLLREGQVLMEHHYGRKPNRPADVFVTDTLWGIINACWADIPNDRPTMEKIRKYIKHQLILENLPY